MKISDLIKSLKGQSKKDVDVPPKDEWPSYIEILDKDDFEDFIYKYPVTLIDFHSPTCKPCRAMKPRLRKLSKEYEGKAVFGKVNVNENKELNDRYGITSVPTFIIFKYGKKKKFLKGKLPLSDLKQSLDDVISDIDFEDLY